MLITLLVAILIIDRTQQTLRRMHKIILICGLPSLIYYLYISRWVVSEIPKFVLPFFRNLFSNFIYNTKIPTSAYGTFFNQWLREAYLTSRIVYFLVGIVGVASISYILIVRRPKYAKSRLAFSATIALSTTLSGIIFFGFGEGIASFSGRFQQFSYIYLSMFAVYPLIKLARNIKVNRPWMPKLMAACLIMSTVLLYLPIHFQFAAVGELPFYSTKFYFERGTDVYTPVYRPEIMGVLGFFTGHDWLSGPPGYLNNLPLNLTTVNSAHDWSKMNILYSNGEEVMETYR